MRKFVLRAALRPNQIKFSHSLLVAALWAAARGDAGGHKARPYAMRFRYDFDDAH
jgi:hypothetical protein